MPFFFARMEGTVRPAPPSKDDDWAYVPNIPTATITMTIQEFRAWDSVAAADVREELVCLYDRIKGLETVLRSVQWVDIGHSQLVCPSCRHAAQGHFADCQIALALLYGGRERA